jgi:SAM-dependent methyltransferase
LAGVKKGTVVNSEFHYYRCQSCNFLFVDPFFGPEIYDEKYYEGKGADPFVNYAAEYEDYRKTDRILELNDLARITQKSLTERKFNNTEIRWLDFGCGAGGLLKFLRDRKDLNIGGKNIPISVAGCDVGAWADKLRKHDGFDILDADHMAEIPDESYDVISMIEVLEHIPSGREVLRLIARLLKPGGLLLLTTGNLSSTMARREGLDYGYCLSEIHISLYDPQSLTSSYQDAGLDPLYVQYRGVVAFKAIKTVRGKLRKFLARLLFKLPIVTRLVDRAYGVSAMPCATKPSARSKSARSSEALSSKA